MTARIYLELWRVGVIAGSVALGCSSDSVANEESGTADGDGTTEDGETTSTSSSTTRPVTTDDAGGTSSGAADETTGAQTSLRWTAVAVGYEHGCGIDDLGRLFCWGNNGDGQLGVPDAGPLGPTEVTTPAASWSAIAAGHAHTCAITSEQELWCFGRGDTGALGTGSLRPVQSPTRVDSRSGWASVAGFEGHSCAIDLDAHLWCWGMNDHAQIGVPTSSPVVSPSLLAGTSSAIAGGSAHTCRIDTGEFLSCWGWNVDYRLGIAGDGSDDPEGRDVNDVAVALGSEIAGSYGIFEEGWLARWGGFYNGLGVELTEYSHVGRRNDWVALARGMSRSHMCVIDQAAELYCIGRGEQGQLGDGASVTTAYEPTVVAEPGPWSAVAIGGDQTCAIRTDDASLWCWGALVTSTRADACGLDPATVDRTRPVAMCP
jgi:alpha-tubulin suppressor-like RCC1 family protein